MFGVFGRRTALSVKACCKKLLEGLLEESARTESTAPALLLLPDEFSLIA